MAVGQFSTVIQQLRCLLNHGATAAPDESLLERYLSQRDEAAFEALVRRHGPMVLGVCRRILGNVHDAEDAFQATFLVLVRKAASIRPRSMVGNWLYGVACRTALDARKVAAKRRAKEAAGLPRTQPPDQDRADLRAVLDEELQRLPPKCRAVIILSDLEGKTRKEVALQLDWPEGSVASRLARARARLAKRLARYGLTVSGASVGALLSEGVASASMPPSLVSSTVNAALLSAAGKAVTAGLISTRVAVLTEGVLKAMLLNKLKTTAWLLVLMGVVAAGWANYRTLASDQPAVEGERQVAQHNQTEPPKEGNKAPGEKKKPADRNDKEKATDTIIRPVVIVIDANTKGIPQGAQIKEIDASQQTIAKKALRDVKDSRGQAKAGLDREYAVKSAKITLADDTVVECTVLLSADEPERLIIKNVQRAGQVLEATSDEGAGKWTFCTGEYKITIDRSKDRPAKQRDIKALQGQWRVVSSAIIGPAGAEKNLENEVKKHKVLVSGDKLTYEFNNEQHDRHEGTILLDPKRNWIDWTQTAGGKRIGTMLGIYEIKGDNVRLFFGVDGIVRPRGFDDVGWLLVLKRKHPDKDAEKKEALKHSNEAFAALINGDYDKAIAEATEAIRFDPENMMAYLNRGSAYVLKGEPDQAIKDFDRVIQLDPKEVRGYDNRAAAYAAKGDYRKAVEDYREAMRVGPKKYEPYAYLADLLATCPDRDLRDGKKAVELATKACELTKWNDSDSLSALAAAYAEVGDFKMAVEWQKKAMKANGTLVYKTKQQEEESRQRLKSFEEGKPFRRQAPGGTEKGATTGDDQKALQGTWRVVSIEAEGVKSPVHTQPGTAERRG